MAYGYLWRANKPERGGNFRQTGGGGANALGGGGCGATPRGREHTEESPPGGADPSDGAQVLGRPEDCVGLRGGERLEAMQCFSEQRLAPLCTQERAGGPVIGAILFLALWVAL